MSKNKGYIVKFRQSKTFRGLVVCMILNIMFEIIQPTAALALTEGPSQPEVQSFEPIGTTQMVDMFSGDFNYNIPLFNLPGPNGGYPVNLAYHAGSTMDDEASWVGLGWNLNVGSLVRSTRGLPDEFKSTLVSGSDDEANENSDYLLVKTDVKKNWTFGLNTGMSLEIVGSDVLSNLSLNSSIYYNSYNGIGISTGANFGLAESPFNIGLSLDSENGLGMSASASISHEVKDNSRFKHELSLSFNGQISVDYSISAYDVRKDETTNEFVIDPGQSIGSGISFARNNFTASQANRLNTFSTNFTVKGGIQIMPTTTGWSGGLFFNTQDLNDHDKSGRRLPVMGYASSGDVTTNSEKYTLDYTRVNDGQITKSTMFLPYSVYNYDVYNSTGQGLSGYFRPRRSDIGRVYDPENTNNSYGLSVTLDFGAGTTAKFGFGIGLSYGHSKQGPWDNDNEFRLDFKNPHTIGTQENLYYQAHGEQTILHPNELNHIYGLDLPFIKLSPNEQGDGLISKRKITQESNSSPNNMYSTSRTPNERVVRNTMIHNLSNSEASKLGEFKLKYFTSVNQVKQTLDASGTFNRDLRNGVQINGHPAGYKVLNQDGTYYVYGLPAYNNKEISNLFSVEEPGSPTTVDRVENPAQGGEVNYDINGTNKFIRKTTTSPYAHSYLLTSVQGADYVDLANDGPTDDDLGYWVKFTYIKHADNYKWRAPYTKSMYNRGSLYTAEDDMASYQYGEKELWYVGQIETKSHVAVFHLSEREDMLEAAGEIVNDGEGSTSGLQIDSIKVYEKNEFKKIEQGQTAVALQTVHFQYDNSLCTNVPNGTNNQGKLTLKKLWFTSNGSQRGSKSKYDFDYQANATSYVNPSYRENTYDSWGNYKPLGSNLEHHSQFPYTNQFNQDWTGGVWEPNYGTDLVNAATKELTKQTQAQLASVWSLKRIGLPSGGHIDIEYESDDYGYVQHKTANQMFKIDKLGDFTTASNEVYPEDDVNYTNATSRRIYFKLEEPIPSTVSQSDANIIVYDSYVKPIIEDENHQRNLYFKTKMRLVNGISEYISGYLALEPYSSSSTNYGVSGLENGMYTKGFVTVKAAMKKKKENGQITYFDQYHPLALAGWTYLQTNAQKLLNNPNSFEDGGNFDSPEDLLGAMADLMNIVPATASNFGMIRSYCKSQNMCRYIDLNNSCIRLASPDKIKYGGGHRVKKISINDNWSADTGETDRVYGQEFDYTIEENGKVISSGVAQYEPQLGGDENALKYPIYFFEKASIFTKNNLFTEAPVNENLFPGPSVGYRKVTVKSINTAQQLRNNETQNNPRGRTGGVTIHEFYTSKEFPTMVQTSVLKEENDTKDVKNIVIPIPLIGSIKRDLYHGVQAYKIELNDMHGKPKSIKSYEITNDYEINPAPITETVYEYQADEILYNKENVWKLNNTVNVVADNNEKSVYWEGNQRIMGVEYDLFTDQRQNSTFHFSLDINVNLDVPSPSIPFPSVWPTINKSESTFRTYVTNKVIHRSGILKRTIARDLQTVNDTEMIAYDEKSGQPLVTKVKNEFGDEFFNYNIPAHYVYDKMGHAYRNINYTFSSSLSRPEHYHENTDLLKINSPTQSMLDNLVRGDEVIIRNSQGMSSGAIHVKGYFLGWKYVCESGNSSVVQGLFHFPENGDNILNGLQQVDNVNLKVIRSGRRNHYSSIAANYLTKGEIPSTLLEQTIATSNVNGDPTVIKTALLPEIVLAASATVYREDWPLNNQLTEDRKGKGFAKSSSSGTESQSSSTPAPLQTSILSQGADEIINPYLTGTSGIWRPLKTYSYAGKRKISGSMDDNTTSDPKLYDDGVFIGDDLPMFTWEIGDIEDYVSNWEWVNEVTRFSFDSYEIENINRLNIKSSALYGYDNSLSIGVGGNAGYYEIGVDDFETAPSSNWINSSRIEQNHLNFHNLPDEEGVIISDKASIKEAVYDCNGHLNFKIKNPSEYVKYFFNNALYNGDGYTNSTFGLSLVSRKNNVSEGNKNYFFNGALLNASITTVLGEEVMTVKIKPYSHCANETLLVLKGNMEFTGSVTMYEHRDFLQRTYLENVTPTTEKAHTGKKSMKIIPGAQIVFDQPMINTLKNKKYIASCWVSRENTDVSTYKPTSGHETNTIITPGYVSGNDYTPLPLNSYKVTYGKVIEGWQKIDIEYSVSEFGKIITFRFDPGLSDVLYVDDFRISPKTGGMTSYVYDPSKYWLRATLNVDNYATFYYYDEEGNLTLKKQETEKGIFTVTESRGHISEQEL